MKKPEAVIWLAQEKYVRLPYSKMHVLHMICKNYRRLFNCLMFYH